MFVWLAGIPGAIVAGNVAHDKLCDLGAKDPIPKGWALGFAALLVAPLQIPFATWFFARFVWRALRELFPSPAQMHLANAVIDESDGKPILHGSYRGETCPTCGAEKKDGKNP